jgi:hypothetical protein
MGGDSASLISRSCGLFLASWRGFPIVEALDRQMLVETLLSGGRGAFRFASVTSPCAGDF